VEQTPKKRVQPKAKLCSTGMEFYITYPGEYGRAPHLAIMDDLGKST
jgi:hypothetical protein